MNQDRRESDFHGLDSEANEEQKKQALRDRCREYRERLKERDPQEVARLAAMSITHGQDGNPVLCGEHFLETYHISWPGLAVTSSSGKKISLQKETLWLHYLDRADGEPLTRRWVNLSEIGGLFYQQAFQGYCGDELAAAWGSNLEGLRHKCRETGGWELPGPGDLAFEWRILPRLPACLCYRLPGNGDAAWATMLFDAAAGHYVAADVAAITGKELAERLKPGS